MAEQTRTTVSFIHKYLSKIFNQNIYPKYSSKIFIQKIYPKYLSKILPFLRESTILPRPIVSSLFQCAFSCYSPSTPVWWPSTSAWPPSIPVVTVLQCEHVSVSRAVKYLAKKVFCILPSPQICFALKMCNNISHNSLATLHIILSDPQVDKSRTLYHGTSPLPIFPALKI